MVCKWWQNFNFWVNYLRKETLRILILHRILYRILNGLSRETDLLRCQNHFPLCQSTELQDKSDQLWHAKFWIGPMWQDKNNNSFFSFFLSFSHKYPTLKKHWYFIWLIAERHLREKERKEKERERQIHQSPWSG